MNHFQHILAPSGPFQSPDLSHIIPHGYVTKENALNVMKPITISEIEEVIKATNPNKAPGPGGFNAHFFKVCWPIIGNDVFSSIQDFFKHGSMLKQIKNTFIVLVSKTENTSFILPKLMIVCSRIFWRLLFDLFGFQREL